MDKIIGIGNALIDVIVTLKNNDLFNTLGLNVGSMQLIDENKLREIQLIFNEMHTYKSTGGSAGNTIRALAKLGGQTGFIGKVGNDEYGKFYIDSLRHNGTEAQITISTDKPSGIASTFISPNGERTFGTYLGAAALLTEDCITSDMLTGYKYLYIEGYLVQSHRMILKAMQLAKAHKMKICIDLASFNIVENDLEFFKMLIHDYVNIVFANEQEACVYAGGSVIDALNKLGEECDIVVVKVGAEGSFVRSTHKTIKINTLSNDKAIDTNGAGDYYAAGFLYGVLNGCSLERCGKLGSLLSDQVIRVIGTTLPEQQWIKIKKDAEHIISNRPLHIN